MEYTLSHTISAPTIKCFLCQLRVPRIFISSSDDLIQIIGCTIDAWTWKMDINLVIEMVMGLESGSARLGVPEVLLTSMLVNTADMVSAGLC